LATEIADGTLTWQSLADEMSAGALAKTVKLNHEVEIRP